MFENNIEDRILNNWFQLNPAKPNLHVPISEKPSILEDILKYIEHEINYHQQAYTPTLWIHRRVIIY